MMALHITGHRMTVDGLDIVARRMLGGLWIVTGCGTRVFTRDEALTALTLAEALASAPPPDSFLWLHIRAWKRALGYPIHPADGPHWPFLTRPTLAETLADALPSADPTDNDDRARPPLRQEQWPRPATPQPC